VRAARIVTEPRLLAAGGVFEEASLIGVLFLSPTCLDGVSSLMEENARHREGGKCRG